MQVPRGARDKREIQGSYRTSTQVRSWQGTPRPPVSGQLPRQAPHRVWALHSQLHPFPLSFSRLHESVVLGSPARCLSPFLPQVTRLKPRFKADRCTEKGRPQGVLSQEVRALSSVKRRECGKDVGGKRSCAEHAMVKACGQQAYALQTR